MKETLLQFEVRADELERFARALTGAGGAFAVDGIIDGALETLEEPGLGGATLKESLYRRIMKLNRQRALAAPRRGDSAQQTPLRRSGDLALALDRLPLDEKEVLLLITLGRFSYASAARTLEIDVIRLVEKLARARAGLERWRDAASTKRRPAYLRIVK